MQGQLPWAMGGLSGQGVAPCGRRAALVSGLPLRCCVLRMCMRAMPPNGAWAAAHAVPHQRPREPFACALRLRHALVAVWPLTAPDGAPGLCVLAAALAALPTRGGVSESPCRRRAGVRNRPAAAWARGSGCSKATAGPCGSTARASYRPAPCTFILRLLQAPTAPARPRAAGCLGSPTGGGSRERRGARGRAEFCAGARAQGRGDSGPPLRLRA